MSNKKTVLVTGGSRGIGKAIADLLSDARVYEVFAPGSKDLDVSDLKSIDKYFKEKNITRLDALVNNAGVLVSKPFLKHTRAEWDRVIDVNLTGAFNMCQKAIPLMLHGDSDTIHDSRHCEQSEAIHSHKSIVNLSSISADGEPNAVAYCASKAALVGFTKSLAMEFAKENITVNAICPGWVRTDMADEAIENLPGVSDNKETLALGSVLQGRWIEASEIAGLVKYLISDEAKAITGQALYITAGLDL